MDQTNLERLKEFSERDLPELDTVVLGALEMFAETDLVKCDMHAYKRPLVVGSGNALSTGRILFEGTGAVFADEGTFKHELDAVGDIDGVVIISASGGKHAIGIAETVRERGLPIILLTNNADAPAKKYVDEDRMCVFPKNREPYTYNTSTYMGMILAQTAEDPAAIHEFITGHVADVIPETLGAYDSFYLIIPPRFEHLKDMFTTKFDELFGARVSGRVFTFEQTEHAKTVVSSEKEYFISFGEENDVFGEKDSRLVVPLPDDIGHAAMMAIGYYVIGRIQRQHPPYFKESIGEYVKQASSLFGQDIPVIVE